MRSRSLAILAALLAVMVAGVAAAYAVFSDMLQITAAVKTGTLSIEFRPPPYGLVMFDDCGNNQVDMVVPNYEQLSSIYDVYSSAVPYTLSSGSVSVACGTATLVDNGNAKVIDVTVRNAYPYYFNGLYFSLYNSGTIPAKLVEIIVETPDGRSYAYTAQELAKGVLIDLDGDGKPDIKLWSDGLTDAASDLSTGQGISSMIGFVVTPDAKPGATLSFRIVLVFQQNVP